MPGEHIDADPFGVGSDLPGLMAMLLPNTYAQVGLLQDLDAVRCTVDAPSVTLGRNGDLREGPILHQHRPTAARFRRRLLRGIGS